MIRRRTLLTTLGSSILLAGQPALASAPMDRAHLHQALVYAPNTELCFWSLQGQKYGAVDGALVHLWDIQTIIAATSRIDADGVLTARVFETFYVFKPGTSESLLTLENPFTGRATPFPAYAARPVDQRYPAARFEKETDTPVGLMTAATTITRRTSNPNIAQLDIEKSINLAREAGAPMRIQEFLSYSAPQTSFDAQTGFSDAALELTIWSDWLPWMDMDGTPGGLFTRAQGRKLKTLSDLPESAAAPLGRDYPALVENPRVFLEPA